ncbi:hypothetical protein A1QO_03965 [Vibrio genomosp. F10 str. ZF-129]|uniref:Uncharacterized protein n=1 Tax=Vibrio genomosp. F10 str. ZF-129 TaxID=1187848 RepID=A0A1E5BJP1_9VIBR|nr:hypothetical protein [Vibrio genomosp. F10]OEE37267.1 hypothetical protein A1QO_03965 [Vibrio genomosp. F10 str. ZF-129]
MANIEFKGSSFNDAESIICAFMETAKTDIELNKLLFRNQGRLNSVFTRRSVDKVLSDLLPFFKETDSKGLLVRLNQATNRFMKLDEIKQSINQYQCDGILAGQNENFIYVVRPNTWANHVQLPFMLTTWSFEQGASLDTQWASLQSALHEIFVLNNSQRLTLDNLILLEEKLLNKQIEVEEKRKEIISHWNAS